MASSVLGAITVWGFSNYVSQQEYGFFKFVTNLGLIAGSAMIFGMHNTTIFYIQKYRTNDYKSKALNTIANLTPLFMLALILPIYFLAKPFILSLIGSSDRNYLDKYYWFLPAIAACYAYITLLEAFLNSQMKIAYSSFLKEIALKLFIIAAIAIYVTKVYLFDGFVLFTVIGFSLIVAMYFAKSAKSKIFRPNFDLNTFSNEEKRDIFNYAFFQFLLTISLYLSNYVDQIILPFLSKRGLQDVAVYINAVFLTSFIQIPARSMAAAAAVELAKSYNDNDLPKVKDIFSRTTINVVLSSMLIAILLIGNLHSIIAVIMRKYEAVFNVFFVLLIGRVFDLATGFNDVLLSTTRNYKLNFILSVLSIAVNIVLIYYTTSRYGIIGTAAGTSISIILFNSLKTFFIYKKYKFHPFSKNILTILLCSLPPIALSYFCPSFFPFRGNNILNPIFDIAVRSIIISVSFLLMVLWLKPSEDLSTYIKTIKETKRLF